MASDKEHLIGRKFVPNGTLNGGAFNFIFRACRECNARKAAAERHISSVTLFTSPARAAEPEFDAIARWKASRDYHPEKQGQLVQDAYDEQAIKHQFGPTTFTFNLVSPPRLVPDAVVQLAHMQVQALFALITTDDYLKPERQRLLPLSQIDSLGFFMASDWGNPHLLEVARRASFWEPRVQIVSAAGYYRSVAPAK